MEGKPKWLTALGAHLHAAALLRVPGALMLLLLVALVVVLPHEDVLRLCESLSKLPAGLLPPQSPLPATSSP